MAKKSVISRAIKLYINTSDDSDLLLDSEPGEYEDYIDLDAKETLPEEAPKLMDFKEAPEAPKEGAQENDPPTIDPGF